MRSPILLDIPDTFETERLILRAHRPGDGAVIHRSVQESLEALRVWMAWARHPQSVEQIEMFARQSAARFMLREELNLLLFRKRDGEHVGNCGIHHIDWTIPKFELGYWARTSMEGQGYITEAINFLTAFLVDTLGARRLEIRCDARNTRSAAVAARCGYHLEATLIGERLDNADQLSDTQIWVKLPDRP